MMEDILIFGVNDLAEIIAESLKLNYCKMQKKFIGYVVDDEYYSDELELCSEIVYKYSELKQTIVSSNTEMIVAIGYSSMNQNRRRLFDRLSKDGWKIGNYIDPGADVRCQIRGIGNIVLDGVSIGVGCQIGNGNIFFTDCTIGHHSNIGDFNFFAIRSSVAGRVNVGNLCFFGNNCCTRDHISIDTQTLVGAGCYIDSNTVSSGSVVVPPPMHMAAKEEQICKSVKQSELCIAILVSAGGSIFRKTLEILRKCNSRAKFIMISDRECKAEEIAREYNLPLRRIVCKSKKEFSSRCKEYLDTYEKIDAVMTFVKRLVTEELIDYYPCVNIHPALLPAFKGFGAVDQAYDAKVKFLGSTLHMADKEMDHGAIIAQIQMPIPANATHRNMLDISFIQTVYLMLLLVDLLQTDRVKVRAKAIFSYSHRLSYNDRCNPCMDNELYLLNLHSLEKQYCLKVI